MSEPQEPFVPSEYDPTGGDGYLRGTWRGIENALSSGLLSDEEYEQLARAEPDPTSNRLRAILAARLADQAARPAAVEALPVAISGIGNHRDPCRIPDTPCLCGLCDFRAEAAALIRAALHPASTEEPRDE